MDNLTLLVQETKKGETSRNHNQKPVDWKFTSENARIKLKRLHPQFHVSLTTSSNVIYSYITKIVL